MCIGFIFLLHKVSNSFANLPDHQQPKVQLMLGNKNEAESHKKMVDYDTAHAFAEKQHKIHLLEVSAKNGTNIQQAFSWLTEALDHQLVIADDETDTPLKVEVLEEEQSSKYHFFCCKQFW